VANIGLPNIFIAFKTAGITAINRGQRGIVALILKDSVHNGPNIYTDPSTVPDDFTSYNLEQINLAFVGGVKPPLKVIVYVEPTAETDYSAAQTYLETTKWDYLAVSGINAADTATMATWVKSLNDAKDIKVKFVAPNYAGDHESIINFATDNIVVGSNTFHTTDYCSRIAGVLAGTPLQMSATYTVLEEVDDCPHLTTDEFNTQIGQGQLLLMNDGEKVKIARAVNSLQTISEPKSDNWKKIKIVDIMDQIHDDIKSTAADSYIGKVPNTYSDKVLLITAIKNYLKGLISSQLIDVNPTLDIDMEAQKSYLESNGVDITSLSDQQIKEYNTGDNVFLAGTAAPLDAMEDIALNISM
jgi:hypothetical protein